MNELDNIITEASKDAAEKTSPKVQPIDIPTSGEGKKSYGEMMTEKRNACYAMIDDAYLDAMSSPENMNRFLAVQSRFERYSLNNNLLIYMQMPDAVRLKDYDTWKKEEMGVKKGSKSIMILEPYTYTGADKQQHRAYNAKNVFDITAVNAPPEAYPQPKSYEAKKLLAALVHGTPVPVRKTEQQMSESAVYDAQNKVIYFKQGLSFNEIFPAIAKALSHAEMARGVEHYRVEEHEFAARCSANVLAQKYGVEAPTVSIHSIPPKFADMESDELKKELSDIHGSVKEISKRMYESLEKNNEKEQGKSGKDSKHREER